MSPDPLDSPATNEQLYTLARAKHLTFPALEHALRMIGTIPDAHAWRGFISNMLLLLGTTLTLAGIIFFFAYNWADMNHFVKFAVLEVCLLGIALFVSWQGLQRISGQVALLAIAILLGALLAVYGQTYQTGADAFSLFLTWAILILPWVLLGAFAPLWLLLLVLLNLSLFLYWEQVITPSHNDPQTDLLLLLFLLNGTAMIAWEYAYGQSVSWLQRQWLGVIIFGIVLTTLIIPTLQVIVGFDHRWSQAPLFAVAVISYLVVTSLSLWYYRYQRHDLLLLAICLLGVLVVFTTLVGRLLPMREIISWLILAIVIVGEATMATKWLLQLATTWQKEAKS